MPQDYRFGVEEEYFLSDATTGAVPGDDALARFHAAAASAVGPASRELLRSQIEVQCGPLADADEIREALGTMRRTLSGVAEAHGLDLVAAGSHPLARHGRQETTGKTRYDRLREQYGIIATRSMCCAMHVHVEVPDPGSRVELMNRCVPFLPLFYALSTGSPFWAGEDSGLKGFRLAAYAQWPRMGLPELFAGQGDYERFVARLVSAGAIPDASVLWWLIRPAGKYPTIELRICDCCTRLDDGVALAMLYRCLLRALGRRPEINAGFDALDRGVAAENIWQAQRHGIDARFVDAASGAMRGVAEVLAETLDLVAEDAAALGCTRWLDRVEAVVAERTSADTQLATFRAAPRLDGGDDDALRAVVRWLRDTTRG